MEVFSHWLVYTYIRSQIIPLHPSYFGSVLFEELRLIAAAKETSIYSVFYFISRASISMAEVRQSSVGTS